MESRSFRQLLSEISRSPGQALSLSRRRVLASDRGLLLTFKFLEGPLGLLAGLQRVATSLPPISKILTLRASANQVHTYPPGQVQCMY